MKKLLALALVVFGLAACQTEPEGLDVNMGGEQEVMLTVSLPDVTRASSAQGFDLSTLTTSNYSLRYIVEVYRVNEGTVLYDNCQRFVETSDATTMVFPVRLAPGYDYRIVAWTDIVEGDSKDDRCYTTSNGLDAVEIIENTWNAMDETRDAYTCVKLVDDFSSASNLDMTLTRPFAKVRVVATDIKDIRAVGLEPKTATVEYAQDMYRSFNAVTGEASAAAAKSHTINYPAPYTDADGELTLFADYIFVPQSGTAKFSLNVYADASKSMLIKSNNFNTEISVESNKLTTIKGDVLTIGGNIEVTVENEFGGTINELYARDAAAAQAALDNVSGNTTIRLMPGVSYGTLYLRPIDGGAQTKEVDWIGNNYHFETYSLFENLTIVGAEGATVDAIKIEGGTYYNSEHSQANIHPVMLSLIELKNVVFDGVTFTGKGGYDPQGYGNAVNLSGNNIKVDGLTFKNCVLNNNENNARLLYKTESTTHVHTYAYNDETYTFTPSLKNITITDCTLNGGYMGLELREAENITITNNEFNVNDRNILLAVNTGCTYSGNITITHNVSNNAKERFVRADGTGDAIVVIKNNTISNYLGADKDYIKVTNGSNVTIEDNTFTLGVSTADAAQDALDKATNGDVIQLQPGVNYGTLIFRKNDSSTVVDITDAGGDAPGNEKYRRIENLTIIGAEGAVVDGFDFQVSWINGSGASYIDVKNLTVKDVTFSGTKTPFNFDGSKGSALGIDGLTIENCKMTDANHNDRFVFQQISGYKTLNDKTTTEYVMTAGIKNLTITGCEINGAYMVIESRAMENLIITDNTFNKIKARDMLITSDTTYHADKTYTGVITITGNTSIEGEERFVRGSLNNSDAVVVIANNTITNYLGADPDPIKVEGGNDVTIENNSISVFVSTAEQLAAAISSNKTVIINSDLEGGSIMLPSNLTNFSLKAVNNATLKNFTISAADGNAYHYENVTFDGITFDNSRILLTGWRTGDETIKNLTITNCVFKNLEDSTSTAPVHINKDASQAVENFTFTNNVIDGAIGGSKSGVYAQVTGNVVFENNVINNVVFRPYVIQVTTDDGINDTFKVTGNTFSGSSVGRAQGLGNNDAGTDAVEIVVSGNIFKGITDAQQICYWNFNPSTTSADLSRNYYDIDIEATPNRIYYNAAASSVADLVQMGVYPFYTALNADGTIDLNSLKQAE